MSRSRNPLCEAAWQRRTTGYNDSNGNRCGSPLLNRGYVNVGALTYAATYVSAPTYSYDIRRSVCRE